LTSLSQKVHQTILQITNQPLTGSIAGANADLFYTIFFPFLPQHQENQHQDQDYKNEDQLIWKIWFEKLLFMHLMTKGDLA